MIVISNSKVVSDTPSADGAKHTVSFATTPKMSCYLAAIVVGNSNISKAKPTAFRFVPMPARARNNSAHSRSMPPENIMRYYDKYFGIKYPYGKLDLVGLADFSAGAMENTRLHHLPGNSSVGR